MPNPNLTELALSCIELKLAGNEDDNTYCHLRYIERPEHRECGMQGERVGHTYRCRAKLFLDSLKAKLAQGYSLREVNDLFRRKIDQAETFTDALRNQEGVHVLKEGTNLWVGYKK